jgi:hypothetical protein
MTRKSPEIFEAICNAICNSPSYANAARTVGISEASLWRWIGESQRGNPEFEFEWMGDRAPLHTHMKAATRAAAATIVQNLMHRAIHGDVQHSFYKGQPQYKLCPKLLSWTSEELSALGLDPYARDEKGNLIPVLITTPPPVALALAAAAAFYPKVWGNNSQITVENRNSGVTTVKHVFADKAKSLPAPVEILAPPVDVGDDDDDDLRDLLGEEPSVESADVVDAPAEPMASPSPPPPQSAPAASDRFGASSMTPEQLAMLSKLRATAVSASASPRPTAMVERFSDADDTNPNRVGPGEIPKGGVKMA